MEKGAGALLDKLLVVGAAGFTLLFRPNKGFPSGKAIPLNVLLGVIAVRRQRTKRTGQKTPVILRKRLVTHLGPHQELKSPLLMEAVRQGICQRKSEKVVWISDGLEWIWNLFESVFSLFAVGILDFHHHAKNLHEGFAALYGKDTEICESQFKWWRRQLLKGRVDHLLGALKNMLRRAKRLGKKAKRRVENLMSYGKKYKKHSRYGHFKKRGYPLGSGHIEASVKWQQLRFKGVGMRWSFSGFRNLAALRDAWQNERLSEVWGLVEQRE